METLKKLWNRLLIFFGMNEINCEGVIINLNDPTFGGKVTHTDEKVTVIEYPETNGESRTKYIVKIG